MTRAVVFLAAAMVAASLGVVAQDVSGGGTISAPQNNTDNSNSSQHSAQQPTSPGPNASAVTASSVSQDSNRSSANGDRSRDSQNVAQVDETPGTNNGQLPQTSTILPLLGLIGLGSLVAGFFARH